MFGYFTFLTIARHLLKNDVIDFQLHQSRNFFIREKSCKLSSPMNTPPPFPYFGAEHAYNPTIANGPVPAPAVCARNFERSDKSVRKAHHESNLQS